MLGDFPILSRPIPLFNSSARSAPPPPRDDIFVFLFTRRHTTNQNKMVAQQHKTQGKQKHVDFFLFFCYFLHFFLSYFLNTCYLGRGMMGVCRSDLSSLILSLSNINQYKRSCAEQSSVFASEIFTVISQISEEPPEVIHINEIH